MELKNISEFNNLFNSNQSLLLDFYADWCGPCKMMAPVVDEIARSESVLKIDIEKFPELAQKFEVRSIPTFVVVKNQEISAFRLGASSKNDFLSWWNNNK